MRSERVKPTPDFGALAGVTRRILILSILLLSCNQALASGGWVNRDGSPVPDTDNMKSKNGFGGWLIVTPDPDWEEKWNTPADNVPHFNEASDVNYGESLTILTFLINPAQDDRDEVDVRCDIQVVRPDNSYSINVTDVECLKGAIRGDPRNIRITSAIIKFIGEEGDLAGDWKIAITLFDKNRGTMIPLNTGFRLVQQ